MERPSSTQDSPITLTPVGVVWSEIKEPHLRARAEGLSLEQRMEIAREQHDRIKALVSEVVFFPEYAPLLEGVEAFSHVLVLYWPHLVEPERRSLTHVHPMGRKDVPKQGIFATCSPARPNPVLITAVKLLERRGASLMVQGFEAVDGSPVLDIKPYNPHYLRVENPVLPEWMASLNRELETG
jgi:tRNA-Thr(GGU) m(6)t(6)A37 methyltransferase TsaA